LLISHTKQGLSQVLDEVGSAKSQPAEMSKVHREPRLTGREAPPVTSIAAAASSTMLSVRKVLGSGIGA
jgi:hypothetical protein